MNHILLNYPDKMRRKGAAGLCVLLALLPALPSCQHDDVPPVPTYEDRYVPLQISIPASEALKRSLGDPGDDPRLPLPDYLYVYTAFTDAAGNTEEVLFSEYSGIRDSWTPDGEGGNVYVYEYTSNINLPLIDGATNAYCYIIASADDLGEHLPGSSSAAVPESKEEIQNIALDYSTLHKKETTLRDLYSSYKGKGGAFEVTNYGQKQSEVSGTLYHVAAKVDIQWNFSETFHEAHPNAFLNTIMLSGLPQEGYVFKPTQNSTGNEQTLLFNNNGDANAGTAVYGREDTYIWQPPQGEFKYIIEIGNGDSFSQYPEQTYDPGTAYDADEVAYYRLRVTLTDLPPGSGN